MALPFLSLDAPFRLATPHDAPALVDLADYAGSGMPMLVWRELASPGVEARAYGLNLASGEGTPLSYQNAVVVDEGNGLIGALISYRRPFSPHPIHATSPAMTVPWLQLNNQALGAWHIGGIAAYPEHRSRGIGTALMHLAERLRQASGANRTSLLVADTNTGARRLYERFGFREKARRPMAIGDWENPGKDWLLMMRG
jgi:ribosomal protein S18 acetylase RimI-like enzyme